MRGVLGVTLDQLRTLRAVARHRSFTQAAEDLCLSQPAVSQQIRTLERECGTRLFDRMGKRALLTQAGEIVLSCADGVVRHLEETQQELDDLQGLRRGKLALAATQVVGIHALPEVLRAFRKKYPGINITLQIAFGETLAEQVLNGSLDLALMGEPDALNKDERLAVSSFWVDELVVITDNQHPWVGRKSVHVTELRDQPFVVPRQSSSVRQTAEDRLRGVGVSVDTSLQFGSPDGVKRAVEVGLGIGLVVRLGITREEVESGRLNVIKLEGISTEVKTCLVRLKDRQMPRVVEAFLAFLETDGREIIKNSRGVSSGASIAPLWEPSAQRCGDLGPCSRAS